MSTEQIYRERRAAVHAALSDPGRLAIVDLLAWGEHAPGELSSRLGMASNLLAHHLRVLEEIGLIARRRSEGDRRRSYVTLLRDVLDTLPPAASLPPGESQLVEAPRVVFVCTHNSARSPLAAALWNAGAAPVTATSAGTHPAEHVHPGAVAVAERRHLALVPDPPRHLDEVLDPADLVVTVCDNAHEELAGRAPSGRGTLHWSIPDPVPGDGPAAFDRVVDDLAARIARLTPAVHPAHHPDVRQQAAEDRSIS